MLERLDYVKLAPRRVLDAGSGPPRRALSRRYPKASLLALDFALPMLRRPGLWERITGPGVVPICAEMQQIPLAEGSIDLAWSNMALHWLSDPLPALKELRRVLAPNGLLMFSTLGPDSLKELRAAAGAARVHGFIDMHDLGDMLLAAGFAAPVMDMEMLTLEYPDADTLLADLRASGQTSARADRPRGLAGKQFARRLRGGLGERPKISFEVVYGHAWKAPPDVNPQMQGDPQVKTVRIFKNLS